MRPILECFCGSKLPLIDWAAFVEDEVLDRVGSAVSAGKEEVQPLDPAERMLINNAIATKEM